MKIAVSRGDGFAAGSPAMHMETSILAFLAHVLVS